MKKIEKITLDIGFDTYKAETPYQDVASGVGLLKVMEKINELIDCFNAEQPPEDSLYKWKMDEIWKTLKNLGITETTKINNIAWIIQQKSIPISKGKV